MNSCAVAAPQMKLEYNMSLLSFSFSHSFSSFKLSPTGTSGRSVRRARGQCLKDEPGGKKAKVPLDSAFQKTSSALRSRRRRRGEHSARLSLHSETS